MNAAHPCRSLFIALAMLAAALPLHAADKPAAKPKAAPAPPPSVVVNRVRYFAAPGAEQAVVGGRIEGSNVSRREGYELLAVIKDAPAPDKWGEVAFDNTRVFRWVRYVGPPGSHGQIAELEFYNSDQRLDGRSEKFGSMVREAGNSSARAFDGNTRTAFISEAADGQFVGLDFKDTATARSPHLDPAPGDFDHAIDVTMRSATPGAVIRYTLDGSMPTATHGEVYQSPIHLEKSATFQAISFMDGRAPSPPTAGSYLLSDSKPGLATFHIGNSLTATTSQFPNYVRTAGYRHHSAIFARPGAWAKELWDVGLTQEKDRWDGLWNSFDHIDHLTLQPRDFDIDEEAGYDIKFFDLARKKSPDFQPWLYCEWTEMKRERPTDLGTLPSTQMSKTFPAATWEESMAGMMVYMEDLQRKIGQTYKEGKRPRIIPSALMMGWVRNMIDHGQLPGIAPGSFYDTLFKDQVHPSTGPLINEHGNGGYVVDLTWFAAFYRQSPEGKVLPIGTTFSAEQTAILQKLAWDVVSSYPDCGLYQEGTEPVGAPSFSTGLRVGDITPITLSSSTPGAWFRYTLDGTTPTRTRGYIYCGVISLRRDMTLKAVAYKSGMADSAAVDGPVIGAPDPGRWTVAAATPAAPAPKGKGKAKRAVEDKPGSPPPFPPEITPPPSGEGEIYPQHADSQKQPGVPAGKQFTFDFDQSKIFPGTTRTVTVYIPAQYKADKPACLYLGLDGLGMGAPIVFDNLIHKGEMPVTIAVGVRPGEVPSILGGEKGKDNPRFNRSNEFDGLSGDLGRFILEEILPEVEKRKTPDGLPILISKNPDDRCTGGGSTGGIGAWTLAWEHPDSFHRVFTAVGTFVGMRGGDRYPVLVRKTEPKPIRIFQQDGIYDEWMGGPEVGDWWMGNLTMERALEFAGYDRNHVWGTGHHGGTHGPFVFPDAMRWMWRDWPQPVKAGTSANYFLSAIVEPGQTWQRADEVGKAETLTVDPSGRVTAGGKSKFGADVRDSVTTSAGNTYLTEADRVVLIKSGGERVVLDSGLRQPSGVVVSPDGLWLAVAESGSHWGYSYRVREGGTVDAKQRFYWFHIPDTSEDSGAGNWRFDRDGRLYGATRMGVEVFDRNGRVRAILPAPGNEEVKSVAFGGEKFDTLYITTKSGVWKRKMQSIGAPPWAPPFKLPNWSAG